MPETDRPIDDGEEPHSDSVSAGGTETILFVEDEEEVGKTTTMLLERAGYTVLSAKDGLEALSVIEKTSEHIDLLLPDVVMPRMGGPELVRELQRRGAEMPFVYCSGYTAGETGRVELDAEVPLLPKPFRSAQLVKAVRSALGKGSSG